MTPTQELIKEQAEAKYTYTWPKNKQGEERVQPVGHANPPNWQKTAKQRAAYTAGAEAMMEHVPGIIKWITIQCSKGDLRNHTNGDFRNDKTGEHFSYEQIVDQYFKSLQP